jgi:hypothetical protein
MNERTVRQIMYDAQPRTPDLPWGEAHAAFTRLLEEMEELRSVLREARPYVFGHVLPPTHAEFDWRSETAENVLSRVDAAINGGES